MEKSGLCDQAVYEIKQSRDWPELLQRRNREYASKIIVPFIDKLDSSRAILGETDTYTIVDGCDHFISARREEAVDDGLTLSVIETVKYTPPHRELPDRDIEVEYFFMLHPTGKVSLTKAMRSHFYQESSDKFCSDILNNTYGLELDATIRDVQELEKDDLDHLALLVEKMSNTLRTY